VHVYSDVDDSNTSQATEETGKDSSGNFNYAFNAFNGPACVKFLPCSWNPSSKFSWDTNRNQAATQLFFFINTFHDHLAAAPIGFTPAAGNFEGNDPVFGENLDGANTAGGLPDANHIDNANFATPPDGNSPRMQMFLWHQPGTKFPGEDPFIASNGSDEADIVYHENTHGLSNRLVVDAGGNSTLGSAEAGAMGEAWSDWYALDFLNNQGFQADTAAPGELRIGNYVGWGNDLIRTQPMDCPVGGGGSACPGGGYTYGDYGKIIGRPEVHADGEIWGETLWDLRGVLGSLTAESLVTRAMELSPANPSFLDMRNSILQADMVAGGAAHNTIWSVFAKARDGLLRGRGRRRRHLAGGELRTSAGTRNATGQADRQHHRPGHRRGDRRRAGRVRRARIRVPGRPRRHDEQQGRVRGERHLLRDVSEGRRTLARLRPRRPAEHDHLQADDEAELPAPPRLGVARGRRKRDRVQRARLHRLRVRSDRCDRPVSRQRLGERHRRERDGDGQRHAEVRRREAADRGERRGDRDRPVEHVRRRRQCGDAPHTVETSPDGTTWTLANEGHFYASNRGHLNTVPLNAGSTANVRYVRFTMINPMVPETGNSCDNAANCGDNGVAQRCGPNAPNPGNFSGCTFMDMSEIEVYGRPA
jgi:hypothetical protein